MSTNEKIAAVAETETKTQKEVARKHGVSVATIQNWKKKFGTAATGITETLATAKSVKTPKRAARRTVAKTDTALAKLQTENLNLRALVGDLFMTLYVDA